MITKTFEYWVINTEDSERTSSDKEAFDTFEDALVARMDYADWYTKSGTCWVCHYLISPAYKVPEKIDELHLHADGSYYLNRYGGETIPWGDPRSMGAIDDLKNKCPLLFK